MKIKKGDRVVIVAGKDKGRVGKVLAAYPREDKVLVEGINRMTVHTKASQTPRGSRTGGIEHKEAPIHVSNVMLAVEVDGKTVGTRVGYRVSETGTKIRYAKRTGEEI